MKMTCSNADRFFALAALVGLFAQATSGAPVVLAKHDNAEVKLSPSQFVSSVLRNFLPAPAVDKIEGQARSVAFELNNELYRTLPDSEKTNKDQYRTAPAAFQNWLEQSLQTGVSSLKAMGNDYRLAANEFNRIENAIDGLSKLKFSDSQVKLVTNFLNTYFKVANPSLNPRDIFNAFKRAVAEAKLRNSTESEGEKRAAQFRTSITAEVGVVADEVVTIASTVVAAAVEGGTEALEATNSFLDVFFNALGKIANLPEPLPLIISVAFPPLNTILNGAETASCFWEAKSAWTFQSWAAWSPWMYCNADLIKLLPVGTEAKMGLGLLFKGLSAAISYISK